MDIVGPLPTAAAQKKFMLVATNYFSKWVEVEAYANIKDKDVTKFVWKNNICRFGIPQAIITDNEATNKTLVTALKKRLEQAKGKDAIIPIEIGLPTIQIDARGQSDESTELGRNLDWVDEVRENASIRMADYQQRAATHYNRKARPRVFKIGTLVL
ncbi:hypothetical protein CK203_035429 [Vitis vinifera]|uniref:Integrase catalytic domain-containing protein n=1 Tax=Vitis vinifera TaxID=29760 RepID=A0A438I3L0_VITVI|nr:hypothetical protein CK203_035429 [Vitis vinifera]